MVEPHWCATSGPVGSFSPRISASTRVRSSGNRGSARVDTGRGPVRADGEVSRTASPAPEHDDPVAEIGRPRRCRGDHDHGEPSCRRSAGSDPPRSNRDWASTDRRLVMSSTGASYASPRADRDPLLHAAGELPGVLVADVLESDRLQSLQRPLLRTASSRPRPGAGGTLSHNRIHGSRNPGSPGHPTRCRHAVRSISVRRTVLDRSRARESAGAQQCRLARAGRATTHTDPPGPRAGRPSAPVLLRPRPKSCRGLDVQAGSACHKTTPLLSSSRSVRRAPAAGERTPGGTLVYQPGGGARPAEQDTQP